MDLHTNRTLKETWDKWMDAGHRFSHDEFFVHFAITYSPSKLLSFREFLLNVMRIRFAEGKLDAILHKYEAIFLAPQCGNKVLIEKSLLGSDEILQYFIPALDKYNINYGEEEHGGKTHLVMSALEVRIALTNACLEQSINGNGTSPNIFESTDIMTSPGAVYAYLDEFAKKYLRYECDFQSFTSYVELCRLKDALRELVAARLGRPDPSNARPRRGVLSRMSRMFSRRE